ncbi:MAG TPA: DUF58 domain-containing protein [Acidobacteriota bacterium]|nr:DUF58 domain-containing protein [Acidobacteriota bacterium]
MISKEVLKKVRRIEISTRGLVNDVFSGQYHSVFKGRGMDFSEVREYQFGDDVRTIDWNVTARTGHPFVKVFEEERELTVMLLVDVSSSNDFGTADRMKGEIAVEICALLAFSAIKNNDKVGLIIFSDQIEKFVPPRKGRQHVLRVIRELLYHQPQNKGTDIGLALGYVNRVVRRRSVTFLVSDFFDEGFERALRVANRRHDVIAIRVSDRREVEIPPVGLIELEDTETGERLLLNSSDAGFRNLYSEEIGQVNSCLEKTFKSTKVDYIQIWADQPYDAPLIRFFKERGRRIR